MLKSGNNINWNLVYSLLAHIGHLRVLRSAPVLRWFSSVLQHVSVVVYLWLCREDPWYTAKKYNRPLNWNYKNIFFRSLCVLWYQGVVVFSIDWLGLDWFLWIRALALKPRVEHFFISAEKKTNFWKFFSPTLSKPLSLFGACASISPSMPFLFRVNRYVQLFQLSKIHPVARGVTVKFNAINRFLV